MPDPDYLEVVIDRGWEVWMSGDEYARWTVELVRSRDPAVVLASRPRPLGERAFESPPVALKAVRAALFGEALAGGRTGK
jgi:hypothetical protein